jgi:hypothetical protein
VRRQKTYQSFAGFFAGSALCFSLMSCSAPVRQTQVTRGAFDTRSVSPFEAGQHALAARDRRAFAGAGLERFIDDATPSITPPPPAPRLELPETNEHGYYTLQDIETFTQRAADEHPNLTRLTTIGQSTEGRPINALLITANPGVEDQTDKPRVLITAGLHAREQQPYHFALSLIAELINGYQTSDYVKRLVDTREIWIVPCVNPDGKAHDFASPEHDWLHWRKNRRDNLDGAFGVDLNRNADLRWGGADANTGSITYQGPEPFSEPETKALRRFVDEQRFVSWLELHSAGGEVFMPRYLSLKDWREYKQLYDKFHRSQVLAYGPLANGRQIQPPFTQPPIYRVGNTGTLWQWAYYTRGVYTAIMEIRADPTRDPNLLHYPSEEFVRAEYKDNGRDAMLSWIDGAEQLTPVTVVDPQEGPGFKIDGLYVDDDTRRDSLGDADTVAEPGETVELELDLRNAGHAIAEDVWATLTCEDPAVRVLLEYRSDFGAIEPGQNSSARLKRTAPQFVIHVQPDAPLGHRVKLVFNVFDKQRHRWELPYHLTIGADTTLSQ